MGDNGKLASGFDAGWDTTHDKALKIDLLARVVDIYTDEVPGLVVVQQLTFMA